MKQTVHKLAGKLGLKISKAGTGPFEEMKRLCADIEEPTIFDVGAHHGYAAKEFRKWLPKSRIFCFEPFPDSFESLKLNSANDRGIRVYNYGFSDRVGTFSFHSNSNSETNSLLPTDELSEETWGKGILETEQIVQAQFRTIDSVLSDLGVQTIDILKLDVQGAEPLVLQGALQACKDRKIKIMYSEIITQPTYIGQKRLDEVLRVFFDLGFELHNVYNLSTSSDGKLRQVDAIFTVDSGQNQSK